MGVNDATSGAGLPGTEYVCDPTRRRQEAPPAWLGAVATTHTVLCFHPRSTPTPVVTIPPTGMPNIVYAVIGHPITIVMRDMLMRSSPPGRHRGELPYAPTG